MILRRLTLLVTFCTLAAASPKTAGKALKIYFIDAEGGQATLFVAPSGESMLIDTGWPGTREADRIAAAAKGAGIDRIDYLLITHFHIDHAGGAPELAKRLPIGTYIDHGESVEHDGNAEKLYRAYTDTRGQAKHIVAKPGQTVPIRGLSVRILTAGGEEIQKPLPGAGQKNELCGSESKRETDPSENAQSVGVLMTFGKFRVVDLGDLTWNKEMDLVCPVNRVGKVDLYVVSHHGMNMSGSATLVHALAPRVAIMDNGAHKGGTPEAYQAIKSSPGLEAIWQLHYAMAGGEANNTPEQFLANVSEAGDNGKEITVEAHEDAGFTVTNTRNGFSRNYPAK